VTRCNCALRKGRRPVTPSHVGVGTVDCPGCDACKDDDVDTVGVPVDGTWLVVDGVVLKGSRLDLSQRQGYQLFHVRVDE